jgi:NADPH:quinone reductase-like Zn-dependent oxidoreductase
MKAIVYEEYGSPDVLELKDADNPTPMDNEVLVKVNAAAVNAADLHFLRADPFLIRLMSGLLKPKKKILGTDLAGQVEAIGKNVKQFKSGDEIFGNIFGGREGTFAEYACARENAIIKKPANISFEEAAAVPMAAFTALQSLRDKGKIQSGQKVWLMAHPAVWVRLRCSLPNFSGQKSQACAVQGMWT